MQATITCTAGTAVNSVSLMGLKVSVGARLIWLVPAAAVSWEALRRIRNGCLIYREQTAAVVQPLNLNRIGILACTFALSLQNVQE